MSSDDYAIRVDRLSKRYEIYTQPADRLRQMILPKVRRWMHRVDKAYFHEFWALRDVSMTVQRGETLGIVGRNGSGKSTLLQLICGTLTPTSGEISTVGRLAALLELGAGFNPEFTGRENVRLSALLYGLSEEELRSRYAEILDFARIGDFIDRPVKTYSSGMYVRLAFAVAINVNPGILVVDEALSVGDEAFQRKCFARIDEIRRAGATILFVSHSARTVIELCDRAVLLDAGELLLSGDPKTVVTAYQRLLYAPEDEQAKIRNEMLHTVVASPSYSPDSTRGERSAVVRAPVEFQNLDLAERYEPMLVPESTVEWARRGAIIHDPHFINAHGMRVNVLRPGQEYVYTYRVEITDAAMHVAFGMMLKSVTGLELFGMRSHAIGDAIAVVDPGSVYEVSFRFQSDLLPGTYFMNAGCEGFLGHDDSGFLHRAIDVTMFKIEFKRTNRVTAGFYDLSAEPACSYVRVDGSVAAECNG